MSLNRRDEKKLRDMCSDKGIKLMKRPHGHWQLAGPLLVNYYPDSKDKSAYIAGTTGRVKRVSITQAIEMCFSAPSATKIKTTRRSNNYRGTRKRLLKKSDKCHWCQKKLTLETSTLEHIIPLARGGLNQRNNMTLACYECNQKRGSDMPELKHG